MKFVFVRFVILIMLLSSFKVVVAMPVSDTDVDKNTCTMTMSKQGIEMNCHGSDASMTESCCHSDCDLSYTPLFFKTKALHSFPDHMLVSKIIADPHQIYLPPASPPPIHT